ncbi:MAG TPA: HAD family hydrolase [Patescibacteria group bacterium]|nr:HAD family hydrolase [Patescibacteria group bacterium]
MVLWDVDGVLIWHHPTDPTQDWRCPLAERGYLNLWEDFQRSDPWLTCLSDPARDVRIAFPAFLSEAEVSGVDHEWIIHCWLEGNLRPHRPAVDCLKAIDKAGVQCGIATNQDALRATRLREWLAAEGLDRPPVFASCDIGAAKPDHKFFETLQARLVGKKITFLDDRIENIEAALRVGWVAHHVTAGFKWDEFHRELVHA